MSRFVDWNDLLLKTYFSPASASEEVWIHASHEELDSLGVHLGGAEGLIAAVREGPPWLPANIANCAEAGARLVAQRRSSITAPHYCDPGQADPAYAEAKAPTYLPILALWVLAAADLANGGFYATVSSLLSMPFPNEPAVTGAMERSWQDLEHWSVDECAGRYGLFRARVLGGHRFVGLAKSQCLIRGNDARGMERLFWDVGLRPGQRLTDTLFRHLLEHGKEAFFLSHGLKAAMTSAEYAEPLLHLTGRLLGSWDGRRPKAHGHDAPNPIGRRASPSPDGQVDQAPDELTLALSPSDDVANGWDVRWRLGAARNTAHCALNIRGQRVTASLDRVGEAFLTEAGSHGRQAVLNALSISATEAIDIPASYDDDTLAEGVTYPTRIQRASRRLLAWNTTDPKFGDLLIEREIPLYSPLYILCSPADNGKTKHWLAAEQIVHEDVSVEGLPRGWWMACVPNPDRLSLPQRQDLSNEPPGGDHQRARIRLVGGRPMGGGGSRAYAAYDLPSIEIEAPPSAQLEADGLDIEEPSGANAQADHSGLRRFEIRAVRPGRSAVELIVTAGRETLAQTRLRIVNSGGEGHGEVRAFSLDWLGRTCSDESGLRGIAIAGVACQAGPEGAPPPIEIDADRFANTATREPPDTPAGKLLDALASRGSMGYGAARDLLRRLSDDIDPVPLLLDLRARGHLEVQTDAKGHLVRLHRVAPTLYSLPATHDGLPMFGVCGTLRLSQWATLMDGSGDFLVSLQRDHHDGLPLLRLAATDDAAVATACGSKTMEFEFGQFPAMSIVSWAGGIQDAERDLVSRSMERFSAELGHLQRLHPNTAAFRAVTDGRMSVDPQRKRQLFRFDDPHVPNLQLYILGAIGTDGSTRFSHVHDSRWGVWVTIRAFAEMLRDAMGRSDACPWPMPYDPATRDLWLPARLKPPTILERALVLCSGNGPEVRQLNQAPETGGLIPLVDAKTTATLGCSSPVYAGFLPGPWLRYGWVPPTLAQEFASHLGGVVAAMSPVDVNNQQCTAPA